MSNFPEEISMKLEQLFDPESVTTLTFRSSSSKSGNIERCDFAIKLIHHPTGTEVICNQYESQIQNKAMALVELTQKLKQKWNF